MSTKILDRWVIGVSLCCGIICVTLMTYLYLAPAHVQKFTWQNQRIGSNQRQMVLTFSRLMDPKSVTDRIQITPPLLGRWLWLGQRLVYTLMEPAPYGSEYTVTLTNALDQRGKPLDPDFRGSFFTPPRQILTIGVEEAIAGRLIRINLDTQEQTLLTPEGLQVVEAYPSGEFVYYLATTGSLAEQNLYRLSLKTKRITLLFDHQSGQNLDLKTSEDREIIILERISFKDPGSLQLWIKDPAKQRFRRLKVNHDVGGDFLITPDHQSLIMAQEDGVAILPLDPEEDPYSDFLAAYGQALTIRSDGTYAAMVKFNSDFTTSLWILQNTGENREILRTDGSFLSGAFSPKDPILYILTTLLDPETLTESPLLLALNWETGEKTVLVQSNFPDELNFSLSPDGKNLVYSMFRATSDPIVSSMPVNTTGQSIVEADLWSMVLETQDSLGAQRMSVKGIKPTWIP